jgi:hypothetical protein
MGDALLGKEKGGREKRKEKREKRKEKESGEARDL